jgi:stearoyl-CoA desaturase (Delta-9 desaturase)
MSGFGTADQGSLSGQPALFPGGADTAAPDPTTNTVLGWINFIGLLIPFLGVVAAAALLVAYGLFIGPGDVAVLVVLYVLSALGITVGYHRLFAHRAFETTRPVRILLAVLGSMAGQGPVLSWVCTHRCHHFLSDQPGDPHSPNLHGGGVWGRLRGLWHAQVGWLLHPDRVSARRYAPDLREDRDVRTVDKLYLVWILLSVGIPAAVGWLLTGTWQGAGLAFLWGGLARVCLGQHVGSAVNSICHAFGTQPLAPEDPSRNNVVLVFFGLGEGWHHNHHAFPYSARFGLRWWQLDPGHWFICALEAAGLAWNVKSPSARLHESRGGPPPDKLLPAAARSPGA